MKTIILPAVLTAVLLVPAAPVLAGQGRNAQPRQDGAGEAALTPVEVLNMLDAYALVQAQNALNLSDDKYGEFVNRLKRLQATRRRLQQTRNGLVGELRRLTNPSVQQLDEAAVRDRLRQLRELDARTASEMKTAYEALDEVLDLRQQARFRIFEEMIERRKLDLLMRARRNAGGRGQ
jgi:DNA repair ATPase RecN